MMEVENTSGASPPSAPQPGWEGASLNRDFFKESTAAFQFAFLAILFGIPLITAGSGSILSEESLATLLAFEFGVLMYGWLLAGLFLVPIAVVDNIWLRRVLLLFAALFAVPLSVGYRDEYGWVGLLGFLWLLYVNYCGVFLFRMAHPDRAKMAAEIGFRAIVYIVFFALLIEALSLPTSVERWGGASMLWFGFIYFSVLSAVEYKRFFPRGVNIFYHLVTGRYVRPPKSRIRLRNGKIKARVLKGSHTHQWPILLIAGLGSAGISGFILFHSGNLESWVGIVTLWIFLLPFFLLGLAFLLTAIYFLFHYLRRGPALLETDLNYLQTHKELFARGFIPAYSKRETRQKLDAEIICYKVIPIEEDIIGLEQPLVKGIDKNFHYRIRDNGTSFELECKLGELVGISSGCKPGETLVCHLQLTLHEKVGRIGEQIQNYHWKLAFPLLLMGGSVKSG